MKVQCLPEELPEPQITVDWESRLGKDPWVQASYPFLHVINGILQTGCQNRWLLNQYRHSSGQLENVSNMFKYYFKFKGVYGTT